MTARLITNLGVIDLCVPYLCRHCGAHLGEFVAVDGRVMLDRGRGPRPVKNIRCKCGKQNWFSIKYTIEQVVAMRENG
jgi:hypothetical protein